jgi:hypothetical protein
MSIVTHGVFPLQLVSHREMLISNTQPVRCLMFSYELVPSRHEILFVPWQGSDNDVSCLIAVVACRFEFHCEFPNNA